MDNKFKRILVVDDEAPQLNGTIEALEDFGYIVKGAISAHTAMDQFISFEPYIVLMDIKLSDDAKSKENGIKVMADMMKIRTDFVRIFLSGNTSFERYQNLALKEAPHHQWLSKSVGFDAIPTEIKYGINRYEAEVTKKPSEKSENTEGVTPNSSNPFYKIPASSKFVKKEEIVGFKTFNDSTRKNYIEMYVAGHDKPYLYSSSFKDVFLSVSDNPALIQIHNGCMINKKYFIFLDTNTNGWKVHLNYKGSKEPSKDVDFNVGLSFRDLVKTQFGIT